MKPIDERLIVELGRQAALSPRRRQHLNLHASYDDPCQRLLNFLWHDSYIRPHRHAADPKAETLIALRGEMGCVTFDDEGRILSRTFLSAGGGCPAVIIEPGEWHSIVALSETALLLETKAGPFDPTAAKEPAPWAVDETAARAPAYLQSLQYLFA
jgi:cupin fold WbuC family metalloprotein